MLLDLILCRTSTNALKNNFDALRRSFLKKSRGEQISFSVIVICEQINVIELQPRLQTFS